MGRHAAPRTTHPAARRAAAVSAGSFLLCLAGATPALASTAPPPVPQPVSDVVQQVSNATGLPNPHPPSEGAARHHRRPAHHAAPKPSTVSTTTQRQMARPAAHPRVVAVPMPVTKLETRPIQLSANESPAVAAETPTHSSSALQALPAPFSRDDTPRILLVAIATMILGGLASGHIKAAQTFVFAQ